MSPPPVDNVQRARETRAWGLRSRGWSQTRIAAELGITQAGVSKILARVERRELRRLSAAVERLKVVQTAQLEHVIEESIDAWHRSKTPRKRAASKRSVGSADGTPGSGDQADEVQTTEVVERDGDTGYLYAALTAMGRVASIWGLDVAPALQEPAASVAELARDLLGRAASYEARRTAEDGQAGSTVGPGPADPGGADRVPDGPEPVQ